MTRIIAVLKQNHEYRPEHVKRLAEQLPNLEVISDVEVEGVPTIKMQHHWHGWWCKMNLFSPEIKGDLFYVDLDTTIVGDISELLTVKETTLLSDFYWINRPASGVMFLTEEDRAIVWDKWIKSPESIMASAGKLGDGIAIGTMLPNAKRWQNLFPGKIVSYKKHIAKRGMIGYRPRISVGNGEVPEGASIVCFHGKPRPWEI